MKDNLDAVARRIAARILLKNLPTGAQEICPVCQEYKPCDGTKECEEYEKEQKDAKR